MERKLNCSCASRSKENSTSVSIHTNTAPIETIEAKTIRVLGTVGSIFLVVGFLLCKYRSHNAISARGKTDEKDDGRHSDDLVVPVPHCPTPPMSATKDNGMLVMTQPLGTPRRYGSATRLDGAQRNRASSLFVMTPTVQNLRRLGHSHITTSTASIPRRLQHQLYQL